MTPAARPPGMPRPPCQTAGTSSQRPRNRFQSVTTWYKREPRRPAGTAQMAMVEMWSAVPPLSTHRRWAHETATITPRAIMTP